MADNQSESELELSDDFEKASAQLEGLLLALRNDPKFEKHFAEKYLEAKRVEEQQKKSGTKTLRSASSQMKKELKEADL